MSIASAARHIRNARHVTAFTGAGISVESGVPPFRGAEGLWSRYDPECLDLTYFRRHPEDSWRVIREIFYDFFAQCRPNDAHIALAALERAGMLRAVITQNIDNLHQEAGSSNVIEFHGNARRLFCSTCDTHLPAEGVNLAELPPRCLCGNVYKPDFIFFGEMIPEDASVRAFREAELADVFLLIGTTGEVMPACLVPEEAKQRGAFIIEVNTEASNYTRRITDVFLRGKATVIMRALLAELGLHIEPDTEVTER
ncbi:MAG: NAD-dependent deacylase [Bacteroidetes bacterium]|nr:NAD-dependent deacylase [Bacteroidota bacterium]